MCLFASKNRAFFMCIFFKYNFILTKKMKILKYYVQFKK